MKRIARRSGRASGDSWQVIYMDLMTMIMVFFVILWSLNQGKDEGVSETVGDVTTRMINLPGDVLFSPGQTDLTQSGKDVIRKLFVDDQNRSVIQFDTNDLVKRLLVIHGHTDADGNKDKNLILGFQRALSAFQEIRSFNKDINDHVVICTHADNSPINDVPIFGGKLNAAQKKAMAEAKSKNRRITIEDKIVNQFEVEP